MDQEYAKPHVEVIARCRKGDRAAQYELYQLYAKAMLNTAYRIVGDPDDAEDVTQDAFVSAFRNLDSFKGTSTFGAWLKRIVVNKAINFLKKKRPESMSMLEISQQERAISPESGHEEQDWQIEQIMKAMHKLPEGFRMVFSLYLVEGYDHAEVAEIMGITESTSKSQLNRAKKKIRELLKEEVIL